MNLLENIKIVMTVIFLLVVVSYYVLLLIKKRKHPIEKRFSSITVIIPAHNEEMYIKEAIQSVIDAKFKGTKQIIVVDDGSKDNTAQIASSFGNLITLLKTKHSGKSNSMNKALSIATGELVAIVDGDSYIHKDALIQISKEVEQKNVVAACCPVRVRNRKRFICMWLHLAEIYYSLIRGLFSRVNANITTPGPLSIYRKKELKEIGGFSTDGYSEDADVAIRLIRKGFTIGFSEGAIAETNMPHKFKEVFRQRIRFARGLINLLKKHMQMNKAVIDMYTLPIFLFGIVQSIIMGSLTLYQMISGYNQYWLSQGVYVNKWLFSFFLEWLSMVGFVKWTYNVLSGVEPLTILAMVGIISTLLTYPLYLISFLKYDKKIDIWHIIPFIFMAPFWLFIMVTQIISIPEYFNKNQYNIWKKNE